MKVLDESMECIMRVVKIKRLMVTTIVIDKTSGLALLDSMNWPKRDNVAVCSGNFPPKPFSIEFSESTLCSSRSSEVLESVMVEVKYVLNYCEIEENELQIGI